MEKLSPKIVDSEASDHMIGDATKLQNCIPRYGGYTVYIANGSLSKVVGTGFVVIFRD